MRQALLVQLGKDRLDDTRLHDRSHLVFDLFVIDDELGALERVALDPATALAVRQQMLGVTEI